MTTAIRVHVYGDLTREEALEVTGGISNTSKMPEESFSLSARDCITGAKLHNVPDSVCSECYALKGFYHMPVVKDAQARRLAKLDHPKWVDAMSLLTSKTKHFRWFDSGDLQSVAMLTKIATIAMRNPQTNYWLPTKEYKIITEYKKLGGFVPENLVIRPSAPKINQRLSDVYGTSSMVITQGTRVADDVFVCDASHTMKNGQKVKTITKENKKLLGHCGTCRKCWEPTNKVTAYPIH
tara:strand:+ start:546 stop:1259 length:714 start_codon:yes stop_codon:yes gene_type:complete